MTGVPEMRDKRNRILYVKRFLEEETADTHQAVAADIVAHLAKQGITATARTVAQDIDLLIGGWCRHGSELKPTFVYLQTTI